MAEAGIFHPDERIELIEGEIVQMSPIGPRHAGCVINANRLFVTRLGDRAVVSPQNPVVIQPQSEPQPDLLLLRPRAVSYSREHPTPEDVLLAVEVADTTVRFDRLVKARLYARAGIAEFWLFLAADRIVEIYRGPGSDGYHENHIHVDLAQRASGYRSCHWDVRSPEVAASAAAVAGSVPLPQPRPKIEDKAGRKL